MARTEAMAGQPSPRLRRGLLTLVACCLSGCASTSAHRDEPTAEPREAKRDLLEITTPGAAARADDDAGAPGGGAAPDGGGRPGRLLIYSAITGHVPLEEKPAYDPADRYRSPAEREAARARAIESEIQEEIARTEGIDAQETSRAAASPAPPKTPSSVDPDGEPLRAPPAPQLRQVPQSLFESQEMTIPPGQWQNRHELRVVRRSLDVDHDDKPEEIRYVDASSGLLIRAELDRDFDGKLDAWLTYEGGEPAIQVLDSDGDGRHDTWERYRDGRLAARTLDRDGDGTRDSFYQYEGDQLTKRLRDANNDGTIDTIETYRDQHRVSVEEDRNLNGQMDTWTAYQVIDGREVVVGIQRDSRDRGQPDVFETYQTSGGETRILRKEEDVNGDGTIDVVSTYEDGKLVQRAISDEALSPL